MKNQIKGRGMLFYSITGNEIFKKVMPELYEETIKLINGFKPK